MQVALTKGFNRRLVGIKKESDRVAVNSSVEKFFDNPRSSGLNLESLGGRGGLYSARVNRDVRIILHKGPEAWTLLHVDHHDAAYRWAARAKVEPHSHTGVLQIAHAEEVYREEVLKHSPTTEESPLFEEHDDEYLLSLGVPEDALSALRSMRSENELNGLDDFLPEPVWERLLLLNEGLPVEAPDPVSPGEPPLETPEARRQFFIVEDKGELRRALEAPWAEWLVFLHPLQRQASYEDFRGPAKVTGTAGTGKTVVALHRARHLAGQGRRVLLTTYSNTLAADLERKLALVCGPEERGNVHVGTVHSVALDLLRKGRGRPPRPAGMDKIAPLLEEAAKGVGTEFSPYFLRTEWSRVIVAQGIETWEEYRSAPRVGRGVALRARDRLALWEVFGQTRCKLRSRRMADFSDLCRLAREGLEGGEIQSPYDSVIVDEVQDLNPQELLLFKAIGGTETNGLALIGDGGQRIFSGGFSLRALGIEVRGRSRKLVVNYRTSEQIRSFADRLLGDDADDLDEGTEKRSGTRNLFGGPEPEVHGFASASDEDAWVADRINDLLDEGFEADRIGVFARVKSRLRGMESALGTRKIDCARLENNEDQDGDGRVRLGTMHRVKGLEFQAVFVVSVNEGVLPHGRAVEDPDDAIEWREAYQRERQLLYVNITRARELVHVSHHGSPSPFLVEAGFSGQHEEDFA
ncbi:MAG: ATP-dependent helicase [Actinomycetota bacterium]|nr:ATP-dependent helicase [Actinomycetota bacterium]